MHFGCIRNLNISDLFVNLKEIAICSERGVLVPFWQGDSLLLQGDSLFTVIFGELANNIDLFLYSEKPVKVSYFFYLYLYPRSIMHVHVHVYFLIYFQVYIILMACKRQTYA